jgi:hypothetical protein
MTDGPQPCALPGCDELVEQPDDGGPRRLYCSPAHRAAARKARHAARMEATTAQPAGEVARSEETTQPIVKAPDDEQPTTELPAPLGVTREEEPEPAPAPDRRWSPAAAWTVSPPKLPAASSTRTVRTITSTRVKKQKPARTAADRKNAATHVRRRAIASVAIASLVAGGASYFVTNNVIPTTPTPLPPQAANDPSMDADVWADKAQVVLASVSSQLDAVTQAEASWLGLPEQRRAQEPAAVQALRDRKALLEQQRATLTSQLEAFKTLPDRTAELTSAQAQLDAVERTLSESTDTAASPDYQEALRQLESQRDIRRQQRDHAAQALTDLRNGVEQALGSPLPADKDKTANVVERVKAVVAGRPDPGEKKDDEENENGGEHKAADDNGPAATAPREDGGEERGDVGNTAPPDPERPNTPDILADGGSPAGNGGEQDAGDKGGDENGGEKSEGPLQSVAGALGSALGQGDTSNRDESANKREARGDDDSSGESGNSSESGNHGGGLGDVVRGVGGALLGGSDREDDSDDSNARREQSKERGGDDGDDHGDDRSDNRHDQASWFSGRDDDHGDRDDADDHKDSDKADRDDDHDDHDGVRGVADRLLGGDDEDDDDKDSDKADRDDDEDRDHKRPTGKAERKRDKDREHSENRHDKSDSDKDDEHADDDDGDHKRPTGKAERKRDKDREESKDRHDKDDSDDKKDRGEKDRDDDGDHENKDSDDDKKSDHGDNDDDSDGGKSDKKSDHGDDDGGDGGDDDGGDGGDDD